MSDLARSLFTCSTLIGQLAIQASAKEFTGWKCRETAREATYY